MNLNKIKNAAYLKKKNNYATNFSLYWRANESECNENQDMFWNSLFDGFSQNLFGLTCIVPFFVVKRQYTCHKFKLGRYRRANESERNENQDMFPSSNKSIYCNQSPITFLSLLLFSKIGSFYIC